MTKRSASTACLTDNREDTRSRVGSPILSIDAWGDKRWTLNGELHRLDGPAIECADGYKAWYDHGKLHRLGGPAVEWSGGDKEWHVNGRLHRLDGPAIECTNGNRAWYRDGLDHRLDGPAIEYANGGKEWWIDGKRHRLDGPAVEHASDHKEWWIDGERRRLDGPAIEYANGDKQWFLCNQYYTEAKFHAKVALLKKLIGNLKMRRFLRLTRHNQQFAESFYAEGGMGRRWDLASLERTGLTLESQ